MHYNLTIETKQNKVNQTEVNTMKHNEIESIVKGKAKGQFSNMKWHKELKTRKGVADVVTKESNAVVRFGVEYDNIADVKEMRENGELPSENQGLPWGVWKQYPYTIEHKGNEYLRCATVNNTKVHTQYFRNGNPISKAEAEEICLKSEFPTNDKALEIMTINMDNIDEIK